MIKTLLAVGLTTICGFSGLKAADNPIITLDGENEYTGTEVESFIANNSYRYLKETRETDQTDYTIKEAFEQHTSVNNTPVYFDYLRNLSYNAVSEVYVYCVGRTQELQPKLIKASAMMYNATTSQWIFYGSSRTSANNTTATLSANQYDPINAMLPKSIINTYKNLVCYLISVGPHQTIWSTDILLNSYKADRLYLSGQIKPFIDLGYKDNVIKVPYTNQSYTTGVTLIEYMLNTNFISNGYLYDSIKIYGHITRLQLGSETTGYEFVYMYTRYENSQTNYTTIVNQRNTRADEPLNGLSEVYSLNELTNSNSWTSYNHLSILILKGSQIVEVNQKFSTNTELVARHIDNSPSAVIPMGPVDVNTEFINIFNLIAKAFDGFGGFFNMLILPGITIGALISIPLLIGLILWLINMFKRH